VDTDVLGGFELEVALQAKGTARASIARGWRGDRYVVLAHPEGDAAVWCLRLGSAALARRVERALAALRDGTARERQVTREGAFVLLMRNLPQAVGAQVEARFRSWARAEGASRAPDATPWTAQVGPHISGP
jgi:hypothetical protein